MVQVIFEQTYLAGRVIEDTDEKVWTIMFSTLGGKTIELSYTNEDDAKFAYGEMERKYLEALNKLQEVVISLA